MVIMLSQLNFALTKFLNKIISSSPNIESVENFEKSSVLESVPEHCILVLKKKNKVQFQKLAIWESKIFNYFASDFWAC